MASPLTAPPGSSRPTPGSFFAGYARSPIFRAKVREALRRAGLHQEIDPSVWTRSWTAHIQQIGNGHHAALYLSRYVYRVALSNRRIERFQQGRVTFRHTHAKTRQTRRMTLPVQDFMARFLQHVLPTGFAKIRYYGLLSPSCRQGLQRARHLLESAATEIPQRPARANAPGDPPPAAFTEPTPRLCPVCKRGHLSFRGIILRARPPP